MSGNINITYKYITKYLLVICLLASSATQALSQNVSATARLDSSLMVIGGQMDLTLEVAHPEDIKVFFPQFNDTITQNIDIVRESDLDTTFLENQRMQIQKRYRITSFDSGLHYIPPIRFEYIDEEVTLSARTRSMALTVVNPFQEVDPSKGFFDIKLPFNLPFILSELWKYRHWALAVLIIAALAFLGWYYWKKRKIPFQDVLFKEKPKIPPHIIALKELDRIKSQKLWQKGQIKQFHSQLTDTIRHYLEERYHFPALEQTSGEILRELKTVELPDKKLFEKMERLLSTSDLAKFAKYEPLPDENDFCLISAYFFINQTKEEILETPEDAAKKSIDNEAQSETEKSKQKEENSHDS